MTATEPLVLGIESSCDETGIGIVRGSKLLTNTISSSMEEHVRFGGVIPEIASRAHLEAMLPALEKALTEAGVSLGDIDAIAVTAGPGLAGALMVGVAAAKALAVATGKPLYGINHLVAHVGVGLLDDNGTSDGARLLQNAEAGGLGALLVSGGHTEILQVRDITSDVRLLGATLDDAAGRHTIRLRACWVLTTRAAPLLIVLRRMVTARRSLSRGGSRRVNSWEAPKSRVSTATIFRFRA